ncbi:MAG: hypothetical protein IIC71_11765 [Acidobacteria bacterium]|nr:hypothetical protein [Acidobacteriota bacterium]
MQVREIEESLTRLDSVDAVRVVRDGNKIVEVHVLAAPDRTAKQVVRDVQSLVMAKFGESIDRRVVSVVQINAPNSTLDARQRPALVEVVEEPEGARTTITVKLSYKEEEHVGVAAGPIAESARLRLIGEATLEAIQSSFPRAPAMALDGIGPASVGMRKIMIAVVVGSNDRHSEEVAVGSAIEQGDSTSAAVKAILDALNRRLEQLTE